MDSKDKPGPSRAEITPVQKKEMPLGQRVLRAAIAPVVALGLFGHAQTAEASPASRTAPEGSSSNPVTNVREDNPNPANNVANPNAELRVAPNPATVPEGIPMDPVNPADPEDLGNVYVKSDQKGGSSLSDGSSDAGRDAPDPLRGVEIDGNHRGPDGTDIVIEAPETMAKADTSGSEVPSDSPESAPTKPMDIDDNQRVEGPNGQEDMLPMMQPGEDTPVMAKVSDPEEPESGDDPQPGINADSVQIPSGEPMNIDGNQQYEDQDGTKRDILPMIPRPDDGSVVASAKPESGPMPVPEKPGEEPLPMNQHESDDPVNA